MRNSALLPSSIISCVLNNHRLQALALLLLDIHSLHIAVQLLLRALLIVTFPRDAHTQSIWNALDAGLPDLLVQLGVETDVASALRKTRALVSARKRRDVSFRAQMLHTIDIVANFLISLIARGALFLNWTPWTCVERVLISLPS